MTAPVPSPSPTPSTAATGATPASSALSTPSLSPVQVSGSATLTAPNGFVIEVQPAAGSGEGWWVPAAVVAALITGGAAVWVGLLNRKTGKEARDNAKDANTNAARAAGAAERGAAAAEDSAKAAGQSAQAATDVVAVIRESAQAAKTSAESSKVSSAAADRAAGAAIKAALTAETATAQLETWRQREETMRLLRLSVDHAIKAKTDPTASKIGQASLQALQVSTLLQSVDAIFIEQVSAAIVANAGDADEDDEFVVDDGNA